MDEWVVECLLAAHLTSLRMHRAVSQTTRNRGDCLLSDWSAWGECSASCGGGEQERTRHVLVKGENGGRLCDDSLRETRGNCSAAQCIGSEISVLLFLVPRRNSDTYPTWACYPAVGWRERRSTLVRALPTSGTLGPSLQVAARIRVRRQWIASGASGRRGLRAHRSAAAATRPGSVSSLRRRGTAASSAIRRI